MRYLLDTDTLIDCILGTGNTRERIRELIERKEEIALCPVTVAEVYSAISSLRSINF